MWNRIYALFVARNLEFFRDRAALAWSVLLPVLIIFVFAFAFTEDNPEKFKVGIVAGGGAEGATAEFMKTRFVTFIDY
jgi:beta-lactam-binding protein with PASTA domain